MARSVVLGVLIACAGCTMPRGPLPTMILSKFAAKADLVVRTGPMSTYRVSYLVGAQWNAVSGTLLKDGKTIATASGVATTDASTHARSASLSFSGLAPGAGYSLQLSFSLTRPGESPLAEGTSTKDNLTLAAGDNQVELDAQPQVMPSFSPGAPLGAYVESMPANGTQGMINSVVDVVAGIHNDYFYIDDGAVHHIYYDATGAMTTATIAGASGPLGMGNVDGPGALARFNNPTKLLVARDGSVYVSDNDNYEIRKISFDAQGAANVTTVIGTGASGFQDGPPASAQLAYPAQMAFDPNGNIVFADTSNNAIRLLTLTGPGAPSLTTIAGSTYGHRDGPASQALFWAPEAVAVDKAGRIFVGESGKPDVRMLTPSSGSYVVSTLAGTGGYGETDGPGSSATFNGIGSLVVDASGDLMLFDRRVRKVVIDQNGAATVTTLAGQGSVADADVPAANATLSPLATLALDTDGSLLIGDGPVIQRLTDPGAADSMLVRIVGTYPVDPRFTYPRPTPADGHLDQSDFAPAGLACDASGSVYAIEGDTDYMAEFSGGKPTAAIQHLTPAAPEFNNDNDEYPKIYERSSLVTRDGLTFYYAHPDSGCIRRITRSSLDSASTTVTFVAGTPGTWDGLRDGPGSVALFYAPSALTYGPNGALYCGDNMTVRRLDFDDAGNATVTTLAGTISKYQDADGPAATAGFSQIQAMVFDSKGDLLVADDSGVRKVTFNPDGSANLVSTLLQGATDFGTTPVTLTAMVIDEQGNLYVASSSAIFKVVMDQHDQPHVSLFAGGTPGFADGPISSARFNGISSLAFDPRGYLFVSDSQNWLVRRITLN
ncbi:MAG TPA: hypothetical protein V6D47_17745 [Oscillatoriaceae cyanobacterium]